MGHFKLRYLLRAQNRLYGRGKLKQSQKFEQARALSTLITCPLQGHADSCLTVFAFMPSLVHVHVSHAHGGSCSCFWHVHGGPCPCFSMFMFHDGGSCSCILRRKVHGGPRASFSLRVGFSKPFSCSKRLILTCLFLSQGLSALRRLCGKVCFLTGKALSYSVF